MMKSRTLVAVGFALLAAASVSYGQSFTFTLEGLQEVPPTPSPGTGMCTVFVDDPLNTVDVSCTYQDLLGNTTAAHIHAPAPPGVNAPVILPLPLNPPSGTAGSIMLMDAPLSEANIQNILGGLAYVNIHTVQFPGGEIRGQIVPEPSSLALLVIGALALAFRRSA
jgi:hypothetical protein